MRCPLRPAILVFGCLSGILPLVAHSRIFEPGEFVWCQPEGKFVPGPDYSRSATNLIFCDVHAGLYPLSHRDDLEDEDEPEIVVVDSHPSIALSDEDDGNDHVPMLDRIRSWIRDEMPRIRSYRDEMLSIFAAFLVLLAMVRLVPSLLRSFRRRRAAARRTSVRRTLPFRHGVPQGTTVVPDRLVCEPEGVFDGGMAKGYFAMFRDEEEGRWIPAFVKRAMHNMKEDQFLPALRFEADVLNRLEETQAVPRVLVPPQKITVGGESWTFYAMSFAPGEPWPERGGLGRRTRLALHRLCEALERMHEKKIGHHDLKPKNIHWDARRKVVTLLDLGSAIDDSRRLRNPIGTTYPKSEPWVAPERDGRCLAELSIASDIWVYGLLFCEAFTGGIHPPEGVRRLWPEREKDREDLRGRVGAATSPTIADAVVDKLLAPRVSDRMPLRDFRKILEREWEEDV